ncbi:hypothetical protein [Aquipseudomonas guryensis]|uniref:Uncharacterized protein n=1 Tax=Aquipseudomonas guryensis TaxID=2759165 RepID=A0A7W4DEZ2_9GAMM|nr:hypothetical protein [Pseudomonas guryensis]MBB1521371.1 hypothetical protein [Pseudomonas guryensis]
MHNPFRTPTYEDGGATANSTSLNILLLLLSIIASYMLTKDLRHLLVTHNDSLAQAAKISILHYIYIKAIPFEIAYFRAFSSIAMLILIFFTARNRHNFSRHYFFAIAYGITQLAYQILAITGVIEILRQVSGKSIFDTDFWLHPTIAPSIIEALIKLSLTIVPQIAFLVLCVTVKAAIQKQKIENPYSMGISN